MPGPLAADPDPDPPALDTFAPDRRTVLRGAALTLVGLAGCATEGTGTDPDSGGDQPTNAEATTTTAESASPADETASTTTDRGEPTTDGREPTSDERETTSDGTATPEYDLREANVTAVEFERSNDAYRFSVTLYHDDDGEEGYADWWQVESLDGDRLGRRDLAHPHSTDPFTRSGTIEVPEDLTCVVVRGHDQTHGYGGRAMLVNLDSGETGGVEQGSEPSSFDESDCP
ncbi:hypothetical protein [Halosimplex amylolyticum]|uniref:hypothetical protein n=1 Tax=Halosimplex amylolyticum TaxID=3396616 RepID=UPI003F566C01